MERRTSTSRRWSSHSRKASARPSTIGMRALHQHVHVERNARFELGQLEQRFHHHCGIDRARARLDHEADVLGQFIAHVGDQRQLLLVEQLGDLLDQPRLLHQPGNFGDDHDIGAAAGVFALPARAHAERAAAGGVGFGDRFGRIDDDAAGREIRTLDVFQQRLAARIRACRSDAARRRTARRRCAAGSRSPCRRRCPASRWRADWGKPPAAPPALRWCRHRWGGNRPRPRRCRRSAAARLRSGATSV